MLTLMILKYELKCQNAILVFELQNSLLISQHTHTNSKCYFVLQNFFDIQVQIRHRFGMEKLNQYSFKAKNPTYTTQIFKFSSNWFYQIKSESKIYIILW